MTLTDARPTDTDTLEPTSTAPAPSAPNIDFDAIVRRLSRQSVDKHFDAYEDVAWDDPEFAIDPVDPRFELGPWHPLGTTDWYRALDADQRARLGLVAFATAMRTGWEFENLLQRGLLSVAFRLDNGRPEFRYLHHEVIEESQHSMMFQEFVNRSGQDVVGMPRGLRRLAELFVVPLSYRFPQLFFFFVLGGEDPIDHVQRQRLRSGDPVHPLAERIMEIHVTEEARHLSFARHYLKVEVPALGRRRRTIVSLVVPVLLGIMARLMILPSPALVRAQGVPRSARRQAARDPRTKALLRDSVAKVRRLCGDLGLLTPTARRLWRAFGIWDDPAGAKGSVD